MAVDLELMARDRADRTIRGLARALVGRASLPVRCGCGVAWPDVDGQTSAWRRWWRAGMRCSTSACPA
jgi:hypothetical protein